MQVVVLVKWCPPHLILDHFGLLQWKSEDHMISGIFFAKALGCRFWSRDKHNMPISLQLCYAHLLSLSPDIPSQLPPTMLKLCSPIVS